VVKKFASDVPKISVDVSKMNIAFLNIFVNAIEAMKTGGVLTIETLVKNNRCVIKISDNGNGMSKEQMGRLFEPYFTTKEKGNGLGLANTQNIILAHNGNISAESKLGEGTTFSIFLRFQNPTNQTA
jgi:signal transduction histidine kinase